MGIGTSSSSSSTTTVSRKKTKDTNNAGTEKQYVLSEVETERLMARHSHNDIFLKLLDTDTKIHDSNYRLEHQCYIQLVGKIPEYCQKESSKKFQSDIVENYLQDAILYQSLDQLLEKREDYLVFEDDFGPKLFKMIDQHKTSSYMNLKKACEKYEKEGHMKQHEAKVEETHGYFLRGGIPDDEARAYALAIAFYSGGYSELINKEASMLIRRERRGIVSNAAEILVDQEAALIMYYLITGLSHIDFYWGKVVRYVKLDDAALKDYQPGEIVTWLQFSSSSNGDDNDPKHLEWFKERNTKFIIFSLTGRSIKHFSNAPEEDEVLFLPHTTFLVCDRDYKDFKHIIYLRQVELGFCKNVVMWVDDHILDDHWENKRHMEKASTLGVGNNVHFIPKSNTDTAIAFLRSEFGQRLKKSKTFRIITDMNRENESSPSDAGVRLIMQIRKLGFDHPCLVFTSNAEQARAKFEAAFFVNPYNVDITEEPNVVQRFVLFK